ncbi:MAG: hypothetical protein HC848_07685 [Limnobacter sp.]|nr:hypothetical protein [Limnobacter sp.]
MRESFMRELDNWKNQQPVQNQEAQNNLSFQGFLLQSHLIKTLLARKEPQTFNDLQGELTLKIKQQQESLHDELNTLSERMDPEDPEYKKAADNFNQQYHAIPEQVHLEGTQHFWEPFCQQHGVNASLE